MNSKYGKLENGKIVYAPESLDSGSGVTLNPSEQTYLQAGWKKVVDLPPNPEEGHRVEPSGWTEDGTTVTRVYKQVVGVKKNTPGGPRRFSKLKVVTALKAASLWVLVKAWIEEKGLYDYYLAAQDFAEDNEWFVLGLAEIGRYTGKTQAEIEAILAGCVIDE